MPNRQSEDPPPLIDLYVSAAPGDFVLQIPANWKTTFGAVNPGNGAVGRHDLHCLRVWEGEKLRAVFCDVKAFRDLSIPLIRKVSKETGSSEWTADSSGNFESKTRRLVDHSFIPEPGLGDDEPEIQDIPF